MFSLVRRRVDLLCNSCTKCLISCPRTCSGDTSKNNRDGKNLPKPSTAGKYLREVLHMVINKRLVTGMIPPDHVLRFRHPQQLEEELDLSIGESGISKAEVVKTMKHVIDYSVKTCSPFMRNQLYGGADEIGLAASWLTDALNTNQHTYEVAPLFILYERAVVKKVLTLLGWDAGDGITAPGGAMANMYALPLARYKFFPDVKEKGMAHLKSLTIFTSQDSHYFVWKAAHWLGLGTENIVEVKTDKGGRMIPSVLEEEIREAKRKGKRPFLVNATSGTTVLGAMDPLEPISEICQSHDLWLHVDGAWGGSLLMSEKRRHLLKGVEAADSFTWNPYKMLGVPIQCSFFLTRHQGLLLECNAASATYLFQKDKFYDVSYDTGDKSIQCGRKVDAFKFWLMWKAHGDRGFQNLVENIFHCARYIRERMSDREGFRLVNPEGNVEEHCPNICFWYIPSSLRGLEETPDWFSRLHKVAPELKRRMLTKGSLMVSYQPLPHKGLVNFFRLTLTSTPRLTHEHMDFILDEFDALGSDIQIS
ncbi:unnamed protein product [Darwinula stevensoni]|uniref:Glutamate decarboxylase n=1 Tax=Darwinula stevensoni TaxID=69355 RepID=A0A7R9A8Z6_9CRUS|nr:unnamed protein product [Darwinula stevensoni]CAG0896725.1 unnamed protein product [Darwinula stevensoni]